MPDAFLGLLCFAISTIVVIVVVTVVGHGLWLMFRALFGRAPQANDRSSPRHARACVGCGSEYFTRAGDCEECGLDPRSGQAKELKDLAAATRAVQRLLETGKLTPESSSQVHHAIEARQGELLPRMREPELTPVEQLEAWFGVDLGVNLPVDAKKRALTMARNLQAGDLQHLSANGLAGVAQLYASLGMLSRACELYDLLFRNYPDAAVSARTAREAFRIADDLGDSRRADEWAGLLANTPALLAAHPEWADRFEPKRTRMPLVAPVAVQADEAAMVAPVEPIAIPAVRRVQAPEPIVPPVPPVSATPRRSFAEWIGVFMEERNIMWGELIGGTLIVGCSIALVISLWQTLQDVIPIFPFILLAAVTSALFAAGLYTLHHWKLESTSRGLLVIGTLMVPLNFLVLAGLSKPGGSGWVEYLSEAATVAVFSWLLYRASHVLIQTPFDLPMPSAAAFTGAMLVSVTAQLFAPRWLADPQWGVACYYLLSLLPVLAFVGSLGWMLARLRRVETWSVGALVALLFALGSLTFACGVNLSFALWAGAANLHGALLDLSPALTLLGVPILVAGSLLHQRLTHADRERFGLWRTLGTGIALLGLFVMFAGFAASVGSLPHRWFSGALNVATLLGLAWTLRLPWLHVPMQIYLTALAVFGWRVDLDAMLGEPIAAPRLCGLLIGQTVLAEWLMRKGRRVDGCFYAIGGAVSTALAIATMLRFVPGHPGTMALVLGCAAAVWLVSNLRWRLAEITYACSLVVGGGLFFASRFAFDLPFAQHLLWSALTAATFALAASVSMRASLREWLTNAYRVPLQFASLFATCGVAALLAVEQSRGQEWTVSALACGWLAALWCVIAIIEGWPLLFAAFQAALGLTWLFGIGAWLGQSGWDRVEPYSLHLYALGFASLSLAWELTRITLRDRPRALALLTPEFVPMDRLTAGLLIVLQFSLTMLLSVGSFARELSFTPEAWQVFPAAWQAHAFSIWAWLITLVLACVLLAWLREFDLRLPTLGLTLLLLTIPLLIAGSWFDAQLASASAARWGLAIVYGGVSLSLWNRHRLGAQRASLVPASAIRGLLIAGAIVPMLSITLIVAMARLGGQTLPGPLAESIFVQMGRPVSLLVPLALLSAALAGHGFRERRTAYLFAAGLLINLGCVGGFFLVLQRLGIPRGQAWVIVDALLLSASVAWLWSIVWSWITGLLETDGERAPADPVLLQLNAVLGIIPFALVLCGAVAWIMFLNDDAGRIWTQEVGSPWGWVTFALSAGGSCFLRWQRRAALSLHLLGAWGLGAVALIACSFELVSPGDGFIALMFGSGVFACVWVWFTMLFDPATQRGASALYATLAASVAIFLGCGVLIRVNEHAVWSANAVVLAATAFALLGYQLKKTVWISLATATSLIASTILVVHFAPDHPKLDLCIGLTGLAVVGVSSLAQLAWHRWLHADEEDISDLHWLPLQLFWAFVFVLVFSTSGVFALILVPAHPDEVLRLHANATQGELTFLIGVAWLALLTNVAAALWFVGRTRPGWFVHAFALGGMAVGVGLALSAELCVEPAWLAHHLLTLSWTLLGSAILMSSWLSHAWRNHFPERSARFWVTLGGAVVVLFALRVTMVEPARPFWAIGNTLAISVLLGALAVWTRAPLYTFGSGLLFNVIGLLVFRAWSAQRNRLPDPGEWLSVCVLAQVLSFGFAALVWSLLERRLLRRAINLSERSLLPFSQFAILAGMFLLATGVSLTNGVHLTGRFIRIVIPLAWIALGVLVAAALVETWRVALHRCTRFQLYVCGLCALGIGLLGLNLSIPDWYRFAALLLAGYVLVIAALARILRATPALQALLGMPTEADMHLSIDIQAHKSRWFWAAQLVSIGVVVALSFWIANAFGTWQERMSGALACLLVAAAAFLLVKIWQHDIDVAHGPRVPRYLALTLMLLMALEVGWAALDINLVAINLQRVALTFTTVVAAMFACRFALPRLLRDDDWLESSRRMGSVLGVMSLGLLLVLLGFELVAYDGALGVKRTHLLVALAIPSGSAVAALIGLALYSALSKSADPFAIEGQRRTAYVYLMEALALLFLAHGRLNVPNLFHPIVGQYWYLVVSVLAFVGVVVAEIFKRKNFLVLAVPIKRSAIALAFVPVIAFRLVPLKGLCDGLRGPIPGIAPFLDYLDRMGQAYQMEALCWLLLGIFLGTLARLHRSANVGIIAALAINAGVWVLLGHDDATRFLERPQLWLIPLGLIVLVAEHINRDRLDFFPSLSVRYVGLLCIYLSSTIEMIKEQLDPLFAVALAAIAVAGMMLGILFRVRAFLLTGFVALLIVIFAQIWNAAVLHSFTWVWWASGIVLGVVILMMFALFEKHRNEVAKMLDNMKRWN